MDFIRYFVECNHVTVDVDIHLLNIYEIHKINFCCILSDLQSKIQLLTFGTLF